jgi:hypothetical protein
MEMSEIAEYLRAYFAESVDACTYRAYIIGSVLIDCETARDFDVLLIVHADRIREVLPALNQLKTQFLETTGLELHLTRLSTESLDFYGEFLANILSKPHVVIH